MIKLYKMLQFTLSYLLLIILMLKTIFADPERDAWTKAKLDIYLPTCKPLMSEETLKIYNENYKTADNEEIRTFYVCMLENAGYMKNGKIIIDEIYKDFVKYYQNVKPGGHEFGWNILKTCNSEAESIQKKIDMAGRFVKCVMKQIESEI